MEIDDLKNAWKKESNKDALSANEIRGIIQNKDYGPIAKLKSTFLKRLIVIPIVFTLIILNFSKHHDIYSDILFWIYVAIGIALMAYFYFNYSLLVKMQSVNGPVKNTLEKQVNLMEKGIKWRLLIVRILFVFFIILFEVLLYYGQEPSMVKWYHEPLGLRLACYGFVIMVFYFFSGFMIKYKYQKHLIFLKEIIEQME